jgi:hypothetical protein
MLAERSYADSNISASYESLLTQATRRFALELAEPPSFVGWVRDRVLDGQPFTRERHEYLKAPYTEFHPYQIEMNMQNKIGKIHAISVPCRFTVFASRTRCSTRLSHVPTTTGIYLKGTRQASAILGFRSLMKSASQISYNAPSGLSSSKH